MLIILGLLKSSIKKFFSLTIDRNKNIYFKTKNFIHFKTFILFVLVICFFNLEKIIEKIQKSIYNPFKIFSIYNIL